MAAPSRTEDERAGGPLPPVAGAGLVLRSLARFVRLAAARELRLGDERLGREYRLFDGRAYRVFRDTARLSSDVRHRVSVIEVCFRLRWIANSRVAHWLFERACILTTPFWSGFDGFATKLWMVDGETGAYAGIYQWGEPATARVYLAVLLPVLRVVSAPGSVAFELHEGARLEEFLDGRATTRL